MISFIIYDNDSYRRELYTKVIRKFFYTSADYYKIYEFDRYTKDVQNEIAHIEGVRIYLINVDVPGPDGLDVARKIRELGDFMSPIILLTKRNKQDLFDHLENILFLDIIKLDDKIIRNMMRSLKYAHSIVTRHSVYTFSSFDEIYRIPYNDIYYIIKNMNDDSVTIFTKDDTYLNYATVKGIEQLLKDDPRFFKSHRSCIINLYNIASYDKKDNIVVFNNGMQTDLVSRGNKAILAERLKEFSKVK